MFQAFDGFQGVTRLFVDRFDDKFVYNRKGEATPRQTGYYVICETRTEALRAKVKFCEREVAVTEMSLTEARKNLALAQAELATKSK